MNDNSLQLEDEMLKDIMARATLAQRLVTPDPGVNTEYPLFFHSENGNAGFDSELRAYFVERGAIIRFDSYFNAFPAHLYDINEDHKVSVKIKASGRFYVKIIMARHNKSWEHLYHGHFDATPDKHESIYLPDIPLDGLIFVEIAARRDTYIYDIDYVVHGEPYQNVTLTGVITTFKRNAAVQQTAKRLQKYFDDNQDLLPRFNLLVIDNGGDTDSIPFIKGKVIKNRNLGGAGGFTRGLMEVIDHQLSSHVLFMDDDASFFPESLRRSIAVLQFSKVAKRAIAGAMITEAHKWRMWENAAVFNQRCRPIDNGRDLRNFKEVLTISVAQPRHAKNKYAGWWYFCFPVSSVKVWPFPFFVRGDDSYFSLSNDFEIITVPGVVAHQEDFFVKQTPLTVYLDMRYHIVHHLTFDDLDIGKKNLKKTIKRFFNRFNNSYHYESAEVIIWALKDVLSGEHFWENNCDMSDRRKSIAELSFQEKISDQNSLDITGYANHSPRRNSGRLAKLLRYLTFNGHILPDNLLYKKPICFPLDVRAVEHDSFRRPFTLTLDINTGRGYTCKRNKEKYFNNRAEFKKLIKILDKNYDELRKIYSTASVRMTTKEAWVKRFSKRDF